MDPERYGQLLAEVRPGLIDSPEEHERLLSAAEQIMDKGEGISPEEEKLLALLVFLIETFEAEVQGAGDEDDDDDGVFEPAPPHETLRRLMEGRGLDIADVADIFGNPHHARDAVSGRRPISGGQAKQLAKFFRVPVKLFKPQG